MKYSYIENLASNLNNPIYVAMLVHCYYALFLCSGSLNKHTNTHTHAPVISNLVNIFVEPKSNFENRKS